MNNDIDFKIIQGFPNGLIYEFITNNNQKFEVFIPNNYSRDVSIVLYEHSDGGYFNDWESYLNKFASDECNSIVIRADRRNSVDWYNFVKEKCNLDNNIIINVSFGGGAMYSLRETSEMIDTSSNKVPLTILFDGYVPVDVLKQEGVINNLSKSGAIVLCFSSSDGDTSFIESYKSLAITGVNVLLFSVGDSHFSLNNNYMEDGLYEYSIGTGPLNNRYEISVYDFTNNSFVPVDYTLVSTIDKVYNYFSLPIDNNLEEVSLASLLSNFSAQINAELLKNSEYRGHKLFIKPKAVEFVVNYLENIVTSDLESKLTMVKKYYLRENCSDISEVESTVLKAVTECRKIASVIRDIQNAILKYGSLEYDDNDLVILDSFLGIDAVNEEVITNNIDSFYDDINIEDDLEDFDDFEFLDNSIVNEEQVPSIAAKESLSNNVLYWMNENNKFNITDNNSNHESLIKGYDGSFDDVDGAVDAEDGHMNIFSAALGINNDD